MTSYIIAGASDNDLTTRVLFLSKKEVIYLSQCEFLSIEVKENFPNIDFRMIIKDPKEWDTYIKDVKFIGLFAFLNFVYKDLQNLWL